MFDVAAELRALSGNLSLDWERLKDKTVLITGATGLVGSCCARLLLERNRADAESSIGVVCLARSVPRAREVFAGYGPQDGLVFVEGDVEHVDLAGIPVDYVIHAACPTASYFFVEHPVETADAIVNGTRHMLDVACAKEVAGFVYVSSMEVYGKGNVAPGLERLLSEEDVGIVDPLSVRSCYSEGKRMAEQYCCAYAAEYGVPAMVVRLAQTFGPGIPKDDGRLFALCARNALAGEDIVLKTTGASTRMYLYTADAASALLTVLLRGAPGKAYNAANPATYSSVRSMAELVAGLLPEKGIVVRCEVDPNAPFPPEHHLPLDVSRLEALGWMPTKDLLDMYRALMAYLEE